MSNTSQLLVPRYAWMLAVESGESVPEVCKRFGISRKTFYKWKKIYSMSGGKSESMIDRSRRPKNFPLITPESTVLLILDLKRLYPSAGSIKLRNCLKSVYGIEISERTIWKWLKRREAIERAGYGQFRGSAENTNEGAVQGSQTVDAGTVPGSGS